MCGIAGTTAAEPGLLAELCAALAHRGPDGSGTWADPSGAVGLAHTRLAVIDLSGAAGQPMASDDGRRVLVFNGEIFNFQELRLGLEAEGVRFRTRSDTEVLLAALERRGEAALADLDGMFAFALWDREERSLLLVRDRFGVKPLAYAALDGGRGVAFASEIAALRRHPGIDLSTDPEALSAYLACLYVPAPMTIHRGIRKLPPGHLLRWTAAGGLEAPREWWRPRVRGGRAPTVDEAVEELLPALGRSVARRMVSDVPVGCFLSGGLDSGVVAALMAREAARAGGRVATFTMTFDEPAYDERDAAAAVSRHVGAEHRELRASASLLDRLGPSLRAFGEPFGNPTALLVDELSGLARGHVTVALVGDGGDEVFAGYPRYRGGVLAVRAAALLGRGGCALAGLAARAVPESTRGNHWPRRAREFLEGLGRDEAERYAGWVEYFSPAERRALTGAAADPVRPVAALYREAAGASPLDAMQETDQRSFLPGNLLAYGDAMSMAHGLELRLPYLDHELAAAVGRIDGAVRTAGGGKALLRAAARRLLPAAVVDRPKLGFNPPVSHWLRTGRGGALDGWLSPARLAAAGVDPAPVASLRAEHAAGRRDHGLKLWALAALAAWREGAAA